jgi:Ca2+-binding RTX toxin-like protein
LRFVGDVWRLVSIAGLIAIGTAICPSIATAGTVSVSSGEEGQGGETVFYEQVTFFAGRGEVNDVTVSNGTPDAPQEFSVIVADASAPLTPGNRCQAVDPHTVTCAVEDLRDVVARLGDGNDSLSTDIRIVARGGPGDDQVTGSNEADDLDGGFGTDVLRGQAGSDTLRDTGGDGDILDGGDAPTGREGGDWLNLARRRKGLVVDLERQLLRTQGELDRVRGIENATGGFGDDAVFGDEGPNLLGDRQDIFRGAEILPPSHDPSANDRFQGRAGDDQLDSVSGRDRLGGGGGDDAASCNPFSRVRCVVLGEPGDDYVAGGAGADRLSGGRGDDSLHGLGGDDRLTGGPDRDVLRGGAGDDFLLARDSTRDFIAGGRDFDSARVDYRLDRFRGVNRLF